MASIKQSLSEYEDCSVFGTRHPSGVCSYLVTHGTNQGNRVANKMGPMNINRDVESDILLKASLPRVCCFMLAQLMHQVVSQSRYIPNVKHWLVSIRLND